VLSLQLKYALYERGYPYSQEVTRVLKERLTKCALDFKMGVAKIFGGMAEKYKSPSIAGAFIFF
jgi:hypothetical protein